MDVYWVFVEKLVIAHQAAAAVRVACHGHSLRVLRHYSPPPVGGSHRCAASKAVNLETCGVESAIVVLLAWACSLACALREGQPVDPDSISFRIGGEHRAGRPHAADI